MLEIQENIRGLLNEHICNNGVKAIYICEMAEINPSTFSRFRRGKRNLKYEQINRLREFLNL